MSHTTKDKKKLLSRIRRIKGQSEAIERALEGEGECEEILQLVASCRGALNGLMAELIEGHLRFHVLDPAQKTRCFHFLIGSRHYASPFSSLPITSDVAEVRGDVGGRQFVGPDESKDLAALGIGDGFEGDVHVRQCKRRLT